MKTTTNPMKTAVEEANSGVAAGHGGPFGAVIVRGGEIIARDHNRVLLTNDPTMHAEVAAIRGAAALLGRFSLHDCEIYSTCMPCPMCLGAIMWAKIPKLYYGLSAADAAEIGFDDDYIYDFIRRRIRAEVPAASPSGSPLDNCGFVQGDKLILEKSDTEICRQLFTDWAGKTDRNMY
jgi:guanine deaminase